MQQGLPRQIEIRPAPAFVPQERARLVALLATGLERYLTAKRHGPRARLDFPADLCVYTDDAEPHEDADG